MLRISDVVRIANKPETNIKILKRHSRYKFLKGEYVNDVIKVYTAAIESPLDFNITLLHEMIHARDDIRGRRGDSLCDPWVEPEAIETYRKRPELVDLIKELYGINDFRYYQEQFGLLKKTA